MEWNGMEWTGIEWSGVEWSGMEWSGVEWSGAERSGAEWSGVEWNGMEWNGMEIAFAAQVRRRGVFRDRAWPAVGAAATAEPRPAQEETKEARAAPRQRPAGGRSTLVGTRSSNGLCVRTDDRARRSAHTCRSTSAARCAASRCTSRCLLRASGPARRDVVAMKVVGGPVYKRARPATRDQRAGMAVVVTGRWMSCGALRIEIDRCAEQQRERRRRRSQKNCRERAGDRGLHPSSSSRMTFRDGGDDLAAVAARVSALVVTDDVLKTAATILPQVLRAYRLIALVDIFQYTNIYEVRVVVMRRVVWR